MSAIEESLQLSVMQDFTEGVSSKVALPRVGSASWSRPRFDRMTSWS
jgi:hypothetical protein